MLRELTILGTATLALGACGTGNSDDERTADVYASVIRAVADEGQGDPSPQQPYEERVVYAGPLDDDVEIPLEVQADIVEQLDAEEFATIRFVDERTEAVQPDVDDEPVLEDAVLVLVSEVPDGDAPQVSAERYVDVDTVSHFVVHTARDGGDWVADRLEPAAG
jgi:hypothetical protein